MGAAITLSLLPSNGVACQTPIDDRKVAQRSVTVVPSERQIAWQRLGFTAFVHFGMNTFTDREWGTGKESPSQFNPSQLDANQWCSVLKDAGAKLVMLVAKHHDGFCLWPTKFTEHSVKNSPWRGGKGDVVAEVSRACRKFGLKFGIYLSPADLNSPAYGKSADYNSYFLNQLRELLTGYGPVDEVWFDGATPRDQGQVYNYGAWYALIRELQPQAVIAVKGPDVRWVGNEGGRVRKSEWSVIPISQPADLYTWPDKTEEDLGSRDKLRTAPYLHWYPAETDVSIRPGWFYHTSEDRKVKSADELVRLYYNAVGGNSVLLLNVPPDRRGLINEVDVSRLREMGRILRSVFARNLAEGAVATASNSKAGHSPLQAVDGNLDTCWMPEDVHESADLELLLPEPRRFNRIVLREDIKQCQRIEEFGVDAWLDGGWREVATGSTVGNMRILLTASVNTHRVRIRVLRSRVCPTIAEVGLHWEAPRLAAPAIRRDPLGQVYLHPEQREWKIRYTLDGTIPTMNSEMYSEPFPLPRGGIVRARCQDPKTGQLGPINSQAFDISKGKWRVLSTSSFEPGSGSPSHAVDDDPNTMWHTEWKLKQVPPPHEIVIDLGDLERVKGFTLLPRQDNGACVPTRWQAFVSLDRRIWQPAGGTGRFDNIANNASEQRALFTKPLAVRYLKLIFTQTADGKPFVAASEIGVITR